MLWLPVLLVPQMLFTAGVSWFLAALGVFVRDLGQIIGFLLTIWFFLTPICYPEKSLGACRILYPIAVQEPDLRAGARLPRDLPGRSGARVRPALEAVAAIGRGVRPRPRGVLQVAEVFRGYRLGHAGRPPGLPGSGRPGGLPH